MPTFMLKPKRFPEGWFRSISGVIGSWPEGPGAWVATELSFKPSVSSTDVASMT
jgi:hypothetical protein